MCICYSLVQRMHFPRVKLFTCVLGVALFSGCGSPGVPIPPSLELARPVTDLRASRKGDKVYLAWTVPTHTTDRQNLRHAGTIEICRAPATMDTCTTPVARISFQQPSRNKAAQTGSYTDQLPAASQSTLTSEFFYGVSVLNPYGRSAGLSNQVEVSAAPTLQPPSDFRAQLNRDGVRLSWNRVAAPESTGLSFVYCLYRRERGGTAAPIAGELPVQ